MLKLSINDLPVTIIGEYIRIPDVMFHIQEMESVAVQKITTLLNYIRN